MFKTLKSIINKVRSVSELMSPTPKKYPIHLLVGEEVIPVMVDESTEASYRMAARDLYSKYLYVKAKHPEASDGKLLASLALMLHMENKNA